MRLAGLMLAPGANLGSLTGLAKYRGWEMAIVPDGEQVWADAADACSSQAYNHLGCPIVPGGLVNVLSASAGKLLFQVPLSSGFFPFSIALARQGKFAALSGLGLFIPDANTGRDRRFSIRNRKFGQPVFTSDGQRGYVVLPEENAVAVLALA